MKQMFLPRSTLSAMIGLTIGMLLVVLWPVFQPNAVVMSQSTTPTPTLFPRIAAIEDWAAISRPTEDCPLPCWWGIRPGVTTQNEAQMMLLNQFADIEWDSRTRIDEVEIGGPFDPNYPPDYASIPEGMLYRGIGFHIGSLDGIVDFIGFGFSNVGSQNRYEAADYFSPRHVLETYGTPDFIRVQAFRDDEKLIVVQMALYWDDIDLAISYEQEPGEIHDYSILGIPAPDSACLSPSSHVGVFIRVQAPDNPRPVKELINSANLLAYLEEVFGLSNQEFAQLLIDNDGCIPQGLPIIREEQ